MTMLCQSYPDYLLADPIATSGIDGAAVSCSDTFGNAFAFIFTTQADWGGSGQMTEIWCANI